MGTGQLSMSCCAPKKQPPEEEPVIIKSDSNDTSYGSDDKQFVELFGDKLLTKDGEKDTSDVLKDKEYVMIYFSAHWCPPCRAFTPTLADKYKAKTKNAEIVFVSGDKSDDSFQEYYKEMPWT